MRIIAAWLMGVAAAAAAFDGYSYWELPFVGASCSSAVTDDAGAVAVNPAGLAVGRGWNGLVSLRGQDLGPRRYNLYAQTPAGGLGYDYLYDKGVGRRVSRFSYAAGGAPRRWLHLGAAVSRFAASKPYPTSAWSLGVGGQVRPWRYLSLGAYARNLNEPYFLRQEQSRNYVLGVALRPGWERLTLSCDGAWREGDPLADYKLRAGLDLELLKGIIVRFDAGNDERYGVGVSFGYTHGGLAYNARLDRDYNYLSDEGQFFFNAERRPTAYAVRELYPVVEINGDLNEFGSSFSLLGGPGRRGVREVIREVRAAAEDDAVEGIILKVGAVSTGFGPGLSAMCQELRGEIAACRAAGKKVYAYVEEITNPAGYYIASAADEVYMSPWGVFGGVGTYMNLWRVTALASRFGVDFDYLTAGAYKGTFHQIGPEPTPEQIEEVQAIVDDAYRQFLEGVAASRRIPAERVRELCEGKALTAGECKDAGLVDGVGRFEELKDAIARAHKKKEIKTTKGTTAEPWRVRWGRPKSVRVVVAAGAITRGESRTSFVTGGRTMGADTIVRRLREARKDPDVGAIVLRVDSGGGDGIASDDIYREMRRCAEAGKVVVASMGDAAASGGYFISCGADTIFAQPATLTGSIGVVYAKPVFAGTYEKYGVERTPITSHPHADANTVHRGYSPEEKEWLASIIAHDYDSFLDVVAEARHIPRARLEELAQGRVYTGEAAKSLGLVDELGSLDDAVAYARRKASLADDAPTEYVGADGGFWRRLPAGVAAFWDLAGR